MDEQQARQMRAFQKEYDEMELPVVSMSPAREELDLRMSDGVCLQTILFLPRPDARSCGRSWPVIVQRSPYASSLPLYEFHGRNLACHGFIYIIQFCRGTGESGGEWIPNVNERRDGLDTMAWLQKADWAGRVGFWGASYMALTGWCMADAVPDKVKGMFLSVYGTDRFASAYCKGSFCHDVLTSWAMENAGFPVSADYMESYRYRPQIEVDRKLWGREIPWYREWISSPDEEDPYWQQGFWRQLREIPGKLRIPVYISEGWYDHHLGSALKSYAAIKEEEKERCTLQIGCWNHMEQNCLEWAQPEDLRSSEIKPMTDWFTSLLVKEDPPGRKVSVYIIGRDEWRELSDWPIPDGETLRFYPAADGTLDAEKKDWMMGPMAHHPIPDIAAGAASPEPVGESDSANSPHSACRLCGSTEKGERTFTYDPEDPVLSHGAESMLHTMKEVGSLYQPEPGTRQDVLSFVSEPLARDLVIGGKIRVTLSVASDCEDTAFTAKLMRIGADGRAVNIRSSITSILADHPKGYTPGTKTCVRIEMWDIVFALKAGERLRLDISSSDFPQYSIHSNYPGLWSTQEKTRAAHQTIYCGKGESTVEIPVFAESGSAGRAHGDNGEGASCARRRSQEGNRRSAF